MDRVDDTHLLGLILDSTPDPVILKDSQSRWVYGNHAFGELMGMANSQQYIGKTDADFFSADEVAVFLEIDRRVRENNCVVENEEIVTWPDGRRMITITKKAPFPMPDGTIGVVATIRDITELKQAKVDLETLKAASVEQMSFLSLMSHELRTPLNGIIGLSEVLQRDGLSEQQARDMKMISECGQQLNGIVNAVLTLAQLDSDHIEMQPEAYDLKTDLVPYLRSNCDRARAKGLDFRVSMQSGFPELLWCDLARLREGVLGLVENAVKFTEDGEVDVKFKSTQGEYGQEIVQIVVADTGIGIAADQCERVFEAFSQADDARHRTYDGTGIGLTVARRIARLMKGDVTYENRAGGGSVFTFSFAAEARQIQKPPATALAS